MYFLLNFAKVMFSGHSRLSLLDCVLQWLQVMVLRLHDLLQHLSIVDGVAILLSSAAAVGGLLLFGVVCRRVVRQRGLTKRNASALHPDEMEAGRMPLPPGSLGLPLIGEMLQFIVEV